ncbi:MAG TPA: homoserine kinase [Mycobacteriales bacterium]|jgi:homoserine kinase|nr:homoserine kinase [Mycobacteriales bacterium]
MTVFRSEAVHVRVPATSANLGPGFDALGLALGLHDDVVVRVTGSGLAIRVTGEGADDVPLTEEHLLVRAMRTAFEALGGQPAGLRVGCVNQIPHARGLGSSAATIVAGMLAARALVVGGENRLDDAGLLVLATAMEGHPDNVAACLYGGLTIAWMADGAGHAVRVATHPDVRPVAFVPPTRSSTAEARALMPAVVPLADAAANAGRSALLVHALSTDPSLLLPATVDHLHQPYRAPAMPLSAALVTALRDAGIPAVISGAGGTVLAFAPDRVEDGAYERFAAESFAVHRLDVDTEGATVVAGQA